jgi:hypothetical protein
MILAMKTLGLFQHVAPDAFETYRGALRIDVRSVPFLEMR